MTDRYTKGVLTIIATAQQSCAVIGAVEAVAHEGTGRAAINNEQRSVAVEFDFMNPSARRPAAPLRAMAA